MSHLQIILRSIQHNIFYCNVTFVTEHSNGSKWHQVQGKSHLYTSGNHVMMTYQITVNNILNTSFTCLVLYLQSQPTNSEVVGLFQNWSSSSSCAFKLCPRSLSLPDFLCYLCVQALLHNCAFFLLDFCLGWLSGAVGSTATSQ